MHLRECTRYRLSFSKAISQAVREASVGGEAVREVSVEREAVGETDVGRKASNIKYFVILIFSTNSTF